MWGRVSKKDIGVHPKKTWGVGLGGIRRSHCWKNVKNRRKKRLVFEKDPRRETVKIKTLLREGGV